jgi:hypothetical protein
MLPLSRQIGATIIAGEAILKASLRIIGGLIFLMTASGTLAAESSARNELLKAESSLERNKGIVRDFYEVC